jgi:hypothetical protein
MGQKHMIEGASPWLCRHALQENANQRRRGKSMLQHRISARANTARTLWLGGFILLAGLGLVAGRALADAECGDSEPPKATKDKCTGSYKYNAKHKGCAKVSCATCSVWSGEQRACIDSHSATLTDQDFYTEAVALAYEGHFQESLELLARIKKQDQSRC